MSPPRKGDLVPYYDKLADKKVHRTGRNSNLLGGL